MSSNNAQLQEEGRKLLTAFYAALSALKLYPVENEATQQALTELHQLMETSVNREGGLELRIVGDFFFLNEVRLRLELSNFSTFGSFARALTTHQIGSIEVLPGIEREEWAPFVSLRNPTTASSSACGRRRSSTSCSSPRARCRSRRSRRSR